MPDPPTGAPFDCLVLGAGIAGVTAARDLQRAGLRVLLVEGSDRVGGRMWSKRDLAADPERPGEFLPVEAGAEYVHVRKIGRYKEFWRELERQGFTAARFPKTSILAKRERKGRNRLFFPAWGETRSTSQALEDHEVRSSAPMLFMLELKDLFDPNKTDDLPAREFARSMKFVGRGMALAEYTLSAHTPGLLAPPPPGLAPGEPNPNDTISIAGLLKDEIPDQLIEPAEFRLEREVGGRREIPGYDSLPQAICREFQDLGGELRLSAAGETGRKVVRVERTADGKVAVTTRSGERFTGRAAIATFSVGMLDPARGEGAAIFGDLLTADKRRALEVVVMGPITKFGLVFKERLWGPRAAEMTVLSNPEGEARTFFSNFPDHAGGPHMLTGLLMSGDHLKIKDLDDEAAIAHLLAELQKVFDPGGEPWTPERVLAGTTDAAGVFRPAYFRQDWERDEFARGGNSYLRFHPPSAGRPGVTKAREALKDPRPTLPLFWAGEATAPAYDRGYQPLAVHGAYVSGVRAAEDVRKYLQLGGDPARFDKYYRKKYLERSFLDKLIDWFRDLFS